MTYSPPSSFQRAPPFYQAGSTLSLTCVVDGVSEGVFYEWNSDCKAGSCFALGQSTQSVTKQYLESKDSGNYTCVVFDSLGCTGNASIELQVVGKSVSTPFIYSLAKQHCLATHCYKCNLYRCWNLCNQWSTILAK